MTLSWYFMMRYALRPAVPRITTTLLSDRTRAMNFCTASDCTTLLFTILFFIDWSPLGLGLIQPYLVAVDITGFAPNSRYKSRRASHTVPGKALQDTSC